MLDAIVTTAATTSVTTANRNSQDDDSASILAGIANTPAQMPPKLFYDRLGSTLFTAICELAEYYPTRTEASIFREHGQSMGANLPPGVQMVDLGAGDCRKAAGLFNALAPAGYVGIDISGEFLENAVDALKREYPHITMQALTRDFTKTWTMPEDLIESPLLYFYPGSSIGNFEPREATQFLKRLPRSRSGKTSLLIGIDRVKSERTLVAAYDDSLGVTGAFNRNALVVANRELGTNFDLDNWSHRAVFNQEKSRVEMHLVAQQACKVSWSGGARAFKAGESIHTENSHKYQPEGFATLLREAGFSVVQQWGDPQEWYSVVLAEAID